MATFIALFDGLDLSDGQLELSSPPDSDKLVYSEATIDEEDVWYNLPSDLEDENDDSIAPSLTLPMQAAPISAFILPKTDRKEHSTGARIKAIYMLEDKKPMSQIKEAIGVSRTRVYVLAALARERGWRENENMPLEVHHVLNQLRSRRPAISPAAIKCILKVIL
jgi:hypothetical protein